MASNNYYGQVRNAGVNRKHDKKHRKNDNSPPIDIEDKNETIVTYFKKNDALVTDVACEDLDNDNIETVDLNRSSKKNVKKIQKLKQKHPPKEFIPKGADSSSNDENEEQENEISPHDDDDDVVIGNDERENGHHEDVETNNDNVNIAPLTHASNQSDDLLESDFITFKNLLAELASLPTTVDFVLNPAPANYTVKCRILKLNNLLSTNFIMFLENRNRDIPLLYAQMKTRLKKTIFARKIIMQEDQDVGYFNVKDNRIRMGKVSSNLRNNRFDVTDESGSKCVKVINQSQSILNRRKPLAIKVTLYETLSDAYFTFNNKQPTYIEDRDAYCLDFCGRVLKSSPNNLQIANPDDNNDIIFQMGKIDTNAYICDYAYPFSAYKAFGLALAIFN